MPSTMISSNTRASRSRYSSPQQTPQATNDSAATVAAARSSVKDEQKTFMQKWLEPAVQSKASFQEAGLMRHGVVENMAPLGTLPKAAASKKHGTPAAGQEHTPIRKIILKRPVAGVVVANTPSTPLLPKSEDVTPALTRRSVSSRDVDDDYDPKGTASQPSSSRPKATRRSVGRPSAHRLSSASSTLQQTTANSPARAQDNKETIDRVVEAAVDEALDHFRYPTAWALRTLYDENSSNPHFISMIEQVYHQTADPDTVEEFSRLVHDKKKEGKEDNKGCYYFVPPTTNSRFTPHKPKPAPYTDLITLDVAKFSVEPEEVHPRKKVKHSGLHESARKMATNGMNGIADVSPSRNRGRAGSVGSDSSLSSAKSVSPPPEGMDEDENDNDDVFGVPAGAERTSSAETTSYASGPAARQPIAARHRSRATTKNNGDVSSTPTPTLDSPTTAPPPTTAAPGMPAAVASPLFPKLSKNKGKNQGAASDIKFPSRFGVVEDDDRHHRLRRFARSVTNTPGATSLSWERPHVQDPEVDSDVETPARPSSVRPRASLPPGGTASARATRSQKRFHDEVEDELSPTSLLFPDAGPASEANSRAVTPLPRTVKKPRVGLRIKTSPMKKKNGPSAGIPRASGERSTPPPNGLPNNQDENDDYCSSCGGNGELVCCDGCTRSFHLTCVDPPMGEGHLPDEWYCHVCFSQRFPTRVPDHGGVFGSLLNNLEKKNSSAFRLPVEVRDYFESVKTGADGEYEEIVPPAKTKKKAGVEEVLDFWKVRDADGNAIICHSCQRAAAKDRAIMPCSLCGLHWHLDCLDPPAANAPVPRTFRCPAHVDDLLAKIPGSLGPAHKFRKIKGASVIKPGYTRGLINNGWIDIDGESEDESGWKEVETFGKTYRLPSQGIKLDFLSRVRKLNQAKPTASTVQVHRAPIARGPITVPIDAAEIERQQAALNMVRFSGGEQPAVSTLINALLDNANPAVVSLIARGNSNQTGNSLETADRQSLTAMLEHMEVMQKRLRETLSSFPETSRDVSSSTQEPTVNGIAHDTAPQAIETAVSPDHVMENADIIDTELKATTPNVSDRIPTPENSAGSKVDDNTDHVSSFVDNTTDAAIPSGFTPDVLESPQDPPKVNSDVLTPAATEPDSNVETGGNDEVQEQTQPLDTAMDLD